MIKLGLLAPMIGALLLSACTIRPAPTSTHTPHDAAARAPQSTTAPEPAPADAMPASELSAGVLGLLYAPDDLRRCMSPSATGACGGPSAPAAPAPADAGVTPGVMPTEPASAP